MLPKEHHDELVLLHWLEGRGRADSATIANRIALRSAPFWFGEMRKPWAKDRNLTSLLLLRLLMVSVASRNYPSSAMRVAAEKSSSAFADADVSSSWLADDDNSDQAQLSLLSSRSETAKASFNDAIAATKAAKAASAALCSISFAAQAAFAHTFVSADAWKVVTADCRALADGRTLDGIGIWHGHENEAVLEWQATCREWQVEGSSYAFWLRWYEAALQGKHLNPELEYQIALIDDEHWEKGEDHVAGIIAQMEERHDLKAQVIALRRELTLVQTQAASAAHRAHNQPPELLDNAVEVQRQITIIFDTLDEAEAELSQLHPSPSRLKVIGQALINAGIAIAKYCGGLTDVALKKAAEELGSSGTKWALRIGVTGLVAQAEPVQTLGQMILGYAIRLGQGG